MNPNELELLLRMELAANRTVESLMDRIFNDEDASEAVNALRRLALQLPPEDGHIMSALGYYRGMRWALDAGDTRWLAFDAPSEDKKRMRRECAEQFRRYRELFEVEIAISRRQKSAGMALAQDWSGLESSLREDFEAARFRV